MDDATKYWPREWRQDFELQNKLLEGGGDELLHPREYLQCRYEDTREVREQDEAVRSQRHHEVFLKLIELTFAAGHKHFEADRWVELRNAAVESCRDIADRAYPKPEVKP